MSANLATQSSRISQSAAATELLRRRGARATCAEFSRYVAPAEPPALHHELLCSAIDKIISGSLRRLMVFMPPGAAKSTYGSVRAPAFFLGKRPKESVICASYSEILSTSFGRKVRNLVDSAEYQNLFDIGLAEDLRAKGEWETTEGGSYFACGVGSSVTGRRADLGIIDDPVKGREQADSELVRQKTWDWYLSDFLTRLKPGAAQIIIQTRWNEDDLSGRILPDGWSGESGEIVGFDGQTWLVICLPAEAREDDPLGRKVGEYLWPEWFDRDFWEETKAIQQTSDVRNWGSLYQQTPSPEEGTFFKRAWFKRFKLGHQPTTLAHYGASDYAVTKDGGDATEHGIAGFDSMDALWFVDWWHGHEQADTWIKEQLILAKRHEPYVWVAEGGVIRRAIEPFLRKAQRKSRVFFRTEWLTSNKDKSANARSFQGLASQGMVYIPYCDWGDDLIDHLVSFPGGKYDDKPDVCGLFGRILDQAYAPTEMRSESPPPPNDYGIDDEDDNEDEFLI